MLARLEDDLLPAAQQVPGVTHARSALRPVLNGSGPRVRPRVDLAQPLTGQMRVELGGADASMAQQRLDHAQIRSSFEQMGRETVPKGMWRDALSNARSPRPALDDAPDRFTAQPPAPLADEHRIGRATRRPLLTRTAEVPMQPVARRFAHWHPALLVSLSDHPQLEVGQVEPVEV